MVTAPVDLQPLEGELETLDKQSRVRRRQAQLSDAMSRLRTRAGNVPLERWLAIAGGVLLPLGAVLVLLAWYGAAHTTRVYLQIPYLISGGLLGVGLMTAGGFCYFAFWLTRLVHEQRAQTADALHVARDTAAALERIEQLLASNARTTAAEGARVAERGSLLATRSGTLVHRPDCQVVAGRDNLRRVTGTERGLKPCRLCSPEIPT